MIRIFSIAVLAWLAVFFSAPKAEAAPVDGGHALIELISERTLAVQGETIWLGLSFEMDDGWHIYWKNPGDAGIPPEILWSEDMSLSADAIGRFRWPVPELLPVVPGEIMDYGYSGKVVLPFPVELPQSADGPVQFTGRVDYLICLDVCIPESAEINLLQSVGAEQIPDQAAAERIADAIARLPSALNGRAELAEREGKWVLSVADPKLADLATGARFFPAGHEIVHAADQALRTGPEGLQLDLVPAKSGALPEMLEGTLVAEETAIDLFAVPGAVLPGTGDRPTVSAATPVNLPLLIVLAVLGGLILNLMPCVLPVLSIKTMGVVAAAARGDSGEARRHGLWYMAGVLLSFLALAAAILIVRAATGIATWGFWLQDPLVVTALILIIFVIGLWLLGLFELGTSVQNVGSGRAAKQGSAGAFFTGVLAAIVGAPCTGPFLGAALGAILVRPAGEVVTVLLAMGFGMALPFVALSFLPGLQRILPKPGAWMETLKQVFAFPMFLTAAWLLSVLGALAGYQVAAIVVAGAALIGFGIWVLRSAELGGRAILMAVLGLASIVPVFLIMGAFSADNMSVLAPIRGGLILAVLIAAIWGVANLPPVLAKRASQGLGILAVLVGLIYPVSLAQNSVRNPSATPVYTANYETEAWSPARVAELVAQDRAVFVDFTAEWCATCQANKLQTLKTQPVLDAFAAADVAFLVADYTRPDATIAAELQKHGRAGVPMYLWYEPGDPDPKVLPEILSIDLVTNLAEGS